MVIHTWLRGNFCLLPFPITSCTGDDIAIGDSYPIGYLTVFMGQNVIEHVREEDLVQAWKIRVRPQ
jgi:hypothetical protein